MLCCPLQKCPLDDPRGNNRGGAAEVWHGMMLIQDNGTCVKPNKHLPDMLGALVAKSQGRRQRVHRDTAVSVGITYPGRFLSDSFNITIAAWFAANLT